MNILTIPIEKKVSNYILTVSYGDSSHEMQYPVHKEKSHRLVACWILQKVIQINNTSDKSCISIFDKHSVGDILKYSYQLSQKTEWVIPCQPLLRRQLAWRAKPPSSRERGHRFVAWPKTYLELL